VEAYLKDVSPKPPSSFYNAGGRGIPDIASFSENVEVVIEGNTITVGGTSCAAPAISGVISLLNDARMNHGKSPLGFLNPWLYSTLKSDPSAFQDITQGSNGNSHCNGGWTAIKGWDAVTGELCPLLYCCSNLPLYVSLLFVSHGSRWNLTRCLSFCSLYPQRRGPAQLAHAPRSRPQGVGSIPFVFGRLLNSFGWMKMEKKRSKDL
jgi:hypothetical protein